MDPRDKPGFDPEETHGRGESTASGSATTASPGSIGPYQLVRRLGEGGMGQVWLAQQTAPVRRTVALKLIKAGMDTDEVVARFAGERQALAMMEHPAIARVYDAGSTPDQHPFFVMEFVDGVPITEFCDRRRLSLDDRIALFTQVCEGVQHAHQKAILHRDLKPSNVLVTEQDGKALPKIIDFGLAKAMGPDPEDATRFTQAGRVVGTPVYMSPEQAGPQAADIDTRTDVYSLGVILYELLAGTTPIEDPTSLAPDVLLRTIRETDAPRPSRRILKSDAGTLEVLAASRSTRPAALRRRLSGDLDWICLKALEKDRERRYASPADLAADLKRCLNSEPVLARPPSAAYRSGKFIRRHRLGAGFAASMAILLVAFTIVMAVQAARLARERDLAETSRAQATKQAQLALDTIYQVVTHTDERLSKVAGTNPLRKELLEGAMKNLDEIARSATTSDWADRTMGVALQRMGGFYYQMGRTTDQIRVENQAVAIFRRLSREQPQEQWLPWNIAVSLDRLGAIAMDADPTPAAAIGDLEESLRLRRQLLRDVHQPEPSLVRRQDAVGISATKLADIWMKVGDPEKALAYAREALDTFQAATGSGASAKDRASNLGYAWYNMGLASVSTMGEASAREAFDRSIALRREAVGFDALDARAKLDLQNSYTALGDLEGLIGKPEAALESYGKAVEILEGLLKQDPEDLETHWNMANAQYGIGVNLRALGRPRDARPHFERCLERRLIGQKSDSHDTQSRTEVMLVQAQLGHDAEAIALAKRLRDEAPKHPARLFAVARAYAVCASTAGDGASAARRQDDATTAVRVLGEAVASGYRDRFALTHEPDLRSIQDDAGFKRLLEDLSARREISARRER